MNDTRLPALIVTVLIVATVALGWFVGISPIVTQIAQANAERHDVEALNDAHQAQLDLLKVQYEDMPELTEELAKLHESIPSNVASDDFVDQLQIIAAGTGVSITNVTLGEAVLYGTGADGTAPAAAATTEESSDAAVADDTAETESTDQPVAAEPVVGVPVTPSAQLDGKFFTVPVSLNVNGPPPGVMAFLALCQQSPRLFLLTEWNITGYNSGDAAVAVTGYTFVVHDPAAVALEVEESDSTTDVATDPTPTPTETPTP